MQSYRGLLRVAAMERCLNGRQATVKLDWLQALGRPVRLALEHRDWTAHGAEAALQVD